MNHENHFSRKKRQLSVLANQLQYLISNYQQEAAEEIEKLIIKIKRIIHKLSSELSKPALSKILGAAAFVFGLSFSNQSTAQSFAAPLEKPFNITLDSSDQMVIPTFADLDNDGDMDLLLGGYYGTFKYFQNVGTSASPSFTNPIINPFGLSSDSAHYISVPTFADLDNDGDMDMMIGTDDGNLYYYKNIGTANTPLFDTLQINPFGLDSLDEVTIPTFADLDGDGDLDLLIGGYYGTLKYFQNIGTATSPQFDTLQENPFGLESTYMIAAPTFADIDGDGDLDLFVGEYYGTIKYFENSGTSTNPQFENPQSNPFGLTSTNEYALPVFVDLDGDGDMDLIVGGDYGNLVYFQNLETAIALADLNNTTGIKAYPNPVINTLFIDSDEPYNKIEIFNSIGKSVMIVNSSENKISVADLAPGIYTVTLTSDKGFYATTKLVKL